VESCGRKKERKYGRRIEEKWKVRWRGKAEGCG